MQVKAIETTYRGRRFRSRLEARWAVFFTRAGIKWEYEPEGFETPHGRYLPDFFLPDIRRGLWVEVKAGATRDPVEEAKLLAVVEATEKEGIFVRGIPEFSFERQKWFKHVLPEWLADGADNWSAWAIGQVGYQGAGFYDSPYIFCVCPFCGKIGLEFDGRGERVCSGHPADAKVVDDPGIYGHLGHGDKGYSYHHPKLLAAYDAARSARFEYGETPA